MDRNFFQKRVFEEVGMFEFSNLVCFNILGCSILQGIFKNVGYQFDSKLMFWACFSVISFQIGV